MVTCCGLGSFLLRLVLGGIFSHYNITNNIQYLKYAFPNHKCYSGVLNSRGGANLFVFYAGGDWEYEKYVFVLYLFIPAIFK